MTWPSDHIEIKHDDGVYVDGVKIEPSPLINPKITVETDRDFSIVTLSFMARRVTITPAPSGKMEPDGRDLV